MSLLAFMPPSTRIALSLTHLSIYVGPQSQGPPIVHANGRKPFIQKPAATIDTVHIAPPVRHSLL